MLASAALDREWRLWERRYAIKLAELAQIERARPSLLTRVASVIRRSA